MNSPNSSFKMFVWLADAGERQSIAFVADTLCEYLQDVEVQDLPTSAPSCSHVVEWMGHVVPVFRLRPGNSNEHVNVVVLRAAANQENGYIALETRNAPVKVEITDGQFEAFDANERPLWREALISGFVHDGQSIPIVHPDLLCSKGFVSTANSYFIKHLRLTA
ncbi:hypothetical protein [Hahella sp. NBU794]|uniref:hypothetical protein n=1 Tax=Hahella sp. NBU794 TaxID=3422590 RepID=UPI003D6E9703